MRSIQNKYFPQKSTEFTKWWNRVRDQEFSPALGKVGTGTANSGCGTSGIHSAHKEDWRMPSQAVGILSKPPVSRRTLTVEQRSRIGWHSTLTIRRWSFLCWFCDDVANAFVGWFSTHNPTRSMRCLCDFRELWQSPRSCKLLQNQITLDCHSSSQNSANYDIAFRAFRASQRCHPRSSVCSLMPPFAAATSR